MKRLIGIILCLVLAAGSAQARTQPSPADFQRATRTVLNLTEAVQKTPGASPAMAVIAVPATGEPVIWVRGKLNADSRRPANQDSPFYIASMTKAYVGLLAARLDREGELNLDTTLADVWPALTLPGVDADQVTLRQLLTHQEPFANDVLTFRTAYTDQVRVADYPRLLAAASVGRPAGFDYSNLGYLIYAAALEAKTGRSWKDWLAKDVLTPAGLSQTGAFPSRFTANSVTAGHQWTGEGWLVVPVKADDLMHAAGGLVTSPGDMAKWLKAQLEGRADALTPTDFEAARNSIVAIDVDQDGIPCSGYGLGWYVCRLGGAQVFAHGGGYTGFRSGMGFSRELGAGFAVLTNSDSMTGGLSAALTKVFFASLADPAYQAPDPQAFAAQYAARVDRLARGRRTAADKARGAESWGGWRWAPGVADLRRYRGRYRNARLGEVVITLKAGRLVARLGRSAKPLTPAAKDLFGAGGSVLEAPEAFSFRRDARGQISGLDWTGDVFDRVR